MEVEEEVDTGDRVFDGLAISLSLKTELATRSTLLWTPQKLTTWFRLGTHAAL